MTSRSSLASSLALVAALVVGLTPGRSHAQSHPSLDDAPAVDAQLVLAEPELRVDEDSQVAVRVLAELGMGALALVIGGLPGGAVGAAFGSAVDDAPFFSSAGLEGGVIGHATLGLLLFPATVGLAASWNDGRGDVWAAYAGEAIGIALMAAVLLSSWFVNADGGTSEQTRQVLPVLSVISTAFPIVGALAGYEISDDLNRARPHAEPRTTEVVVMPVASPTSDGSGAIVGAAGAF